MAAKKTNKKKEAPEAKGERSAPQGYSALLSPREKKSVERATPFEEVKVPEGSRKKGNRVGRGRSAGQGKTCGRGQKGQKSRSGYSRQFGFEGGQMPLHRRLPKRGFTSIFKIDYQLLNLLNLDKSGLTGEITPQLLAENGLIGSARRPVKILGNGEISRAFQITADAFSNSARKTIEAAGGTCTVRTPLELRKLQRKNAPAKD